MAAASHVATAVHDVGAAGQEDAKHGNVVVRVVLQIRVLNDQVFAGRAGNSRADCPALAAVRRQTLQRDARYTASDLRRSILRTVVNDDDLLLDIELRQIDGTDLFEQRPDEAFLVVSRDDDREGLHGSGLKAEGSRLRAQGSGLRAQGAEILLYFAQILRG